MPVKLETAEVFGAAIVLCAAFAMAATGTIAPGDAALAALVLVIVWIVVKDWLTFTIPDAAVVALAVLGATLRLAGHDHEAAGPLWPAAAMVLDGAVGAGCFWVVREIYFRLRGYDGLGLGDVKLAGAIGVLVGVAEFAAVVLAASCSALLFVGAARIAARSRPIERLPFGVFLAPAALAVWWYRTRMAG